MVELNFTVDPNMQSGGGEWQALETGDYTGSIVDASQKTSQTGNKYLAVQVTIEGKGSVWDNLNLWHSNPKAVSIATEKLNSIGSCSPRRSRYLWVQSRTRTAKPATPSSITNRQRRLPPLL